MPSKSSPASRMALGGVLAAVAVVLMCMGTLIPVATYACPVGCMLVLRFVLAACGRRTAWAWYGAVTVLSLLLAPDKEAAAVFAALGYYPIVKPALDRRRCPWLWKGLLFNTVILALYWVLLRLLGVAQLVEGFSGLESAVLVLMLVMGNWLFFLTDRALAGPLPKRK